MTRLATATGPISKSQLICGTCLQPILDGQLNHEPPFSPDGIFVHSLASDCVAATARRCAEIVRDADVIVCGGYERQDDGRSTLQGAAQDIRREFPAAFVRIEEVR